MSTVLITGGSGFIGTHLAEALIAAGHRVLAIDNFSTSRPDNVAQLRKHPLFQLARADVRDPVVLDRLASEADVIVHLAAAVGVKLIVERPVHTIETNVGGTEAVLKAAVRYGCRVLIASTSEVYGKGAKFPFSEEDDVLLGPSSKSRWAYAASKLVDEFLGFAYQRELGLPVVVVRLFNTVGPRQTGRYGMVIPRFVRQALRNQPITVYGDGEQARCFCDVRDVVRALMELMQHTDAPGRVFNIGGTEEISMRQLAERIKTMCGSTSDIELVPYAEAYSPGFEDMRRRVPDVSRLKKLVGWEQKLTLEDTLRSVIEEDRRRLDSPERDEPLDD
jgi:nucleoside-diphosphate-sugar epimerase